jgi:AcrR family transcriptional regulator
VSPSPPREPHHLPSGRHGLPRDEVVANQRARVIEAVADVCSAAGYGPMTVQDIIVTAGISRRSFYDLYSSKDDAFLEAVDDISGRLFAEVDAAYATVEGFEAQVEVALAAILRFFGSHPTYAETCLVQIMAAGPEAVDRRNASLRRFTRRLIDAVARELPKSGRPPEIIAEGLVGGTYEILYARVVAGQTNQLPELLPDLAYTTLLPYLGPAAAQSAQRQLRRRAARGAG